MNTNVGLWIDRRKAIVVTITGKGENTRLIRSRAERQLHHSGGLPLEGAYDQAQVPARGDRQRTLKAHLNSPCKCRRRCPVRSSGTMSNDPR